MDGCTAEETAGWDGDVADTWERHAATKSNLEAVLFFFIFFYSTVSFLIVKPDICSSFCLLLSTLVKYRSGSRGKNKMWIHAYRGSCVVQINKLDHHHHKPSSFLPLSSSCSSSSPPSSALVLSTQTNSASHRHLRVHLQGPFTLVWILIRSLFGWRVSAF